MTFPHSPLTRKMLKTAKQIISYLFWSCMTKLPREVAERNMYPEPDKPEGGGLLVGEVKGH